jgi:two-component system response regulator YesN
MKQIKSSGYFKRLVMISCIIGIIPLLLLGYLSYNKSSSIVLDEVTAGNRLILEQNRSQMESHLKTIDTLATQTISGTLTADSVSMLTVLGLEHNYSDIKVFRSLISELIAIQVFELGIEEVHLISFRQDWLVDGGVVYPMKNRIRDNDLNQYLHQLKKVLVSYRNANNSSYWKLVHDEESGYILKLIKHIPLYSSDPHGLLTVSIPVSEISKRLAEGGQLGTTIVLDPDGNVLSHSDAAEIGSNYRLQPYYAEMMNRAESDGFFPYEIDGQDYVVIYDHSEYNQWDYMALMPMEHLMEKSDTIKWYTVISVAIIIVLIVITSFFISLQMYSPIRRIHKFIKPMNSHVKGNEMHVIADQVQHMVLSQSRMEGEIESLNRHARVYFVIKLLQGDIKSSELDDYLDKYGFPTDWDNWCLLALQIDTLEDTQYGQQDHDLLMYAIQNMAEEIVPSTHSLSPITQNKTLFLFIGGAIDEARPLKVTAFNYAELIQQQVKHYLKLKVSIGISKAHNKLTDGPLACQESLDALIYRIRLGQESILFIDEAEPESQDHFRYPKEIEYRLLEAVRQQEYDQAKDNLDQIIAQFFNKNVTHNDYQIFIGRLFNNLTGMVQDAGVSVQEVFQKNVFQSDIMLKMQSPQRIYGWFDAEILQPLLRWMEEMQKKQDINISEAIIEAIHQEYDQDLNIDLFAARLNYHPSYISRVFKKDTGVTFSDYLSAYRIEVSKKWLKDTDMKISDIAEKLRYSTASNFNRNFKKVVEETPSQYREKFK